MVIETFDAKALRHFLAVVRTGSIRKAADHLHVAPSAVSRQIADVERRLELPLFERTARGVVLTEAGQLFVEHAMRVIEDQELLTEQIGQLKHVKQGMVRICSGEGFLADLIEHGLTSFSPVYPTIRFSITGGSTEAILDSITNGDADIGVVYNPVSDTSIRSLTIARQPLCVIAPPGHPLLRHERIALCETLDYPCALLSQGTGVRQLVGRVAADNSRALAPILETTSIDVLRRFVSVGQGLTFLPRFAVATELARGAVGIVELTDNLLTEASAHLIVRARRRLPNSVDRLAGYLAREMVAFQGSGI
jgi:DNA-binding transcriptional LysR family regulator